jgi:hypothetical protein
MDASERKLEENFNNGCYDDVCVNFSNHYDKLPDGSSPVIGITVKELRDSGVKFAERPCFPIATK